MKKTQQKGSKNDDKSWMKWAYVGIALLVAVAMVGSYLVPIISSEKAKVGDTAFIGYTIRDENGRPLITTDQSLLEREYQRGNVVFPSNGMEIQVGVPVPADEIAVVTVLYPSVAEFGLLSFETNAISEALVGMRPGETKTVGFSYGDNDLAMRLSPEEADEFGFNFSTLEVGYVFARGLTTSPNIPVGNETPESPPLRFLKVVEKTPDSVVFTYRYGSADVTLYSIVG
jgi:hypothetical protein